MNLSEPFIRRPVMTAVLTLSVILFGVLSYSQLTVNDLPTVDYPVILVVVSYPGASPDTIANNIATQTRAAAATSQWYADRERQREEQRQGPISFIWLWCFPIFIVLFAGLVLWGFWRWLKIQQANQRILENPVDKLPALEAGVKHRRHDDPLPYIESSVVDSGYQVTSPDNQVHKWVDEVKSKLLSDDKKDEDDDTDN